MWSDNETTIDYLNFGVVADACAKLLQQAAGRPLSVGISGGWGVGKTSLVRMIEHRLGQASAKENTYVVVTFNPWLYQGFDDARGALLQLVGDEVLRLAKSKETLFAKAKKLLARINLLRLAQLGGEVAATLSTGVPVGGVGGAVLKILGLTKEASGDAGPNDLLNPAEPLSLPTEIQCFRTALEELLEELKVTLVVFVDDLDRCLPKTAISTLESIRLLLFLKRSAFVVAADNEFIRGAVRVHFKDTGISDEVATNYFDKLIQVPLHVPRLGTNEAKAYLALLLLERAYGQGRYDKKSFEAAMVAIAERLRTSWKGDAVTLDFLKGLVGNNKEMQAPKHLRSDNGPEFVSRAVLRWLTDAGIDTVLNDPGKPWQNGTNESFNGKFRDECLGMEWFRNRVEAKVLIEDWRVHYNEDRPHSTIGYLTPKAFKKQEAKKARKAKDEEQQDEKSNPTAGAVLN